MRNKNKHEIIDGDLSADIVGNVIDIDNMRLTSVYFKYTGTPEGTLTVEYSDNGVDFYLPTGSSKALTGGPGSFAVWYVDTPATHMRLGYTRTNGTGTVNAWYTLKGE